jgi:uncharacterized membrane protein
MQKGICRITGKEFPLNQLYKGEAIRDEIFHLIQESYPDFTKDDFINADSLNLYRRKYLENLLKEERGAISELENDVISSISDGKLLSEDIEPRIDQKFTFGQRLSDKIADFGGSWTFIIVFFTFLFIWMAINIFVLTRKPFDPYPFILLNLLLSCIAAIQAPIIMMSQNRKEDKDRERSEQDYKVNLKAELEIRAMHEKIDHVTHHILEIIELQEDFMDDIRKKLNK